MQLVELLSDQDRQILLDFSQVLIKGAVKEGTPHWFICEQVSEATLQFYNYADFKDRINDLEEEHGDVWTANQAFGEQILNELGIDDITQLS